MAERDFIGYGLRPAPIEWPEGARIAVSLVVNYEEGTRFERSVPQSCIGAQLIPVTDPDHLKGSIWTPYTVLVHRWPAMSVSDAMEASERLLDRFKPAAVITVEAVSVNKRGVRHGAMGVPGSPGVPRQRR